MPDCAISADPGWDPKSVSNHLEWLRSTNVLPFPGATANLCRIGAPK
ncbi:hypothetical protein FHT28_003339 [Rhizobium sp. SG570]|nr:hypothetical protein [Rhizobium sp. SG570]NRP89995.1 hypothetical protein [Ensifer adhaerens]